MSENSNTQQVMDEVAQLLLQREKMQKDISSLQNQLSTIEDKVYSLLQFWDESDSVAVSGLGRIYVVEPTGINRRIQVTNVTDMMYVAPEEAE